MEDGAIRETIKRIEQIADNRHEFYQSMFSSQKREVDLALNAADRAVIKAETAAEKRFEALNEFRAALSDQQAELITRNEVNLLVRGLNAQLNWVIGVSVTVAMSLIGLMFKVLWK